MAKKKGKSVSFDAMVKFFMHTYDIPTKRDLAALVSRLDQIERLVLAATDGKGRGRRSPKAAGKEGVVSASDKVLDIIQHNKDGIGLADIQLQCGFGEKKLRNILFRLHKAGKIRRISRGIYIGA